MKQILVLSITILTILAILICGQGWAGELGDPYTVFRMVKQHHCIDPMLWGQGRTECDDPRDHPNLQSHAENSYDFSDGVGFEFAYQDGEVGPRLILICSQIIHGLRFEVLSGSCDLDIQVEACWWIIDGVSYSPSEWDDLEIISQEFDGRYFTIMWKTPRNIIEIGQSTDHPDRGYPFRITPRNVHNCIEPLIIGHVWPVM